MSESSQKLFNQNLRLRVLSALALIPIVLGCVWLGGWAYKAMVAALLGVCLHEWIQLTAPKLLVAGRALAYALMALVVGVALALGMGIALCVSVVAAMVLGFSAFFLYLPKDREKREPSALWLAGGLAYLAWSALALIYLRDIPERGFVLTLYLLLIVWGTDTGAYFAGRIIGGPKLLPQISPKKTWAGLFGGMVFAGVFGYAVASGFGEPMAWVETLVAMFLAVVSQAGDFLESYVKRRAGAKDSGTLIPGHGGALDRVDGLLAAALVLALLVAWVR